MRTKFVADLIGTAIARLALHTSIAGSRQKDRLSSDTYRWPYRERTAAVVPPGPTWPTRLHGQMADV